MRRTTAILIAALWTTGLCAKGPEVALDVGTLELAGHLKIQKLQLRCAALDLSAGIGCEDGHFSALLPGFGKIEGTLQAQFEHSKRWQAEAVIQRKGQALADLQKLTAAFGTTIPGEISGSGDIHLKIDLAPLRTEITAELVTAPLNYNEPTGRYATDKLSAHLLAHWDSNARHWELTADSHSGQIYVEPVFLDFSALPLHAEISARASKEGWQLERLLAQQGKSSTITASGLVTQDFKPKTLDLSIETSDLAPLIVADVQPFLIGTRLEGLTASGSLHANLTLNEQKPSALQAELANVALDAGKLGLSLKDLSGHLHWSQTEAPASSLNWREGATAKIPLGPSQISFRVQAQDFELLSPWRQPFLEGALRVERLALRGIGSPDLRADFSGALEPIKLTALCQALGWPEFNGTLGGNLPGLSIRNDVWSVQGALEAQAFDGSIRLENLKAIEPFGVLPRVTADLHLKRLDLESLTGAFSFGRITGRVDGDVEGLRLLAWKPVAFKGRIFSTPGDDTSRRISQRAIDNISSIGGGPTGILSRGFLSLFKDFAYDRIGISCVLQDGRCQMDGIESARSTDGQEGYYLVKGRLLPRIDVVGYAHSVSWNTLIEQIKAAQTSGGLQTRPPAPAP